MTPLDRMLDLFGPGRTGGCTCGQVHHLALRDVVIGDDALARSALIDLGTAHRSRASRRSGPEYSRLGCRSCATIRGSGPWSSPW